MNGIISVTFFGFVLLDSFSRSGPRNYTRAVIRARKLSKRFGDKRVLEGLDLEVPRGGFVLVTGPNGSGKTTLLRLCAGLFAPTGRRARGRRAARRDRLPRPRAARLPRADARSRTSTCTAGSTACPSAASAPARCSSASGSGACGTSGPGRSRAGCSSGSRSAGRSSTTPTCCSSTSRSTGSTWRAPSCSRPSSPSAPGVTALVATHDPEALAARATARLALA